MNSKDITHHPNQNCHWHQETLLIDGLIKKLRSKHIRQILQNSLELPEQRLFQLDDLAINTFFDLSKLTFNSAELRSAVFNWNSLSPLGRLTVLSTFQELTVETKCCLDRKLILFCQIFIRHFVPVLTAFDKSSFAD